MTTSTLAIKQHTAIARPAFLSNYKNWYGLTSCVLSFLFIAYLFAPKMSFLSSSASLLLTFVLVVIVPIAAFILALFSLRTQTDANNKEVIPSYIALSITSLYFMTALAIPLVLVGCYVLYAYIF